MKIMLSENPFEVDLIRVIAIFKKLIPFEVSLSERLANITPINTLFSSYLLVFAWRL